MFASLLFSAVLNRGLEPYWDDQEFYVGVIIEPSGKSLLIRLSDKKGNALLGQFSVGHKKACPAQGGTGFWKRR
jgi:hypothetical protein